MTTVATIALTKKRTLIGLCLLLAAATAVLYWPITRHDFVNYDDHQYIVDNPHVNSGLTWPGIVWSFQSRHAANWHPLTWISHMADCGLYGLNPGGHHFTNLLFHVANTLLLFLLLNQMTGSIGRAFFVAALFAWHPLHVESVAWAAERKDVLSAFFWILALMAYVRYVAKAQSPRSEVQGPKSKIQRPKRCLSAALDFGPWTLDYIVALGCFAIGLMSKPMLVTLPFVLLLIDFWPLNRFGRAGACARRSTGDDERIFVTKPATEAPPQPGVHLILEKLPFLALALGAGVLTWLAQQTGGAVRSWEEFPLGARVANALMTYVRYIGKTLWPADLSVIYPYPNHWPISFVIAASLLLAGLSALFAWRAKRFPYLIMGWLWYLGTLVPVIGFVQVGPQAMADRYTYMPAVGLFILVVWGLNDLARSKPWTQRCLAGLGIAALAGCFICASRQLQYWQDGETLFRHAVQVTTNNYIACNFLGKNLEDKGRKDAAFACYSEAVRINPAYPAAQYNLGTALLDEGRRDEAIGHFAIALNENPRFAEAQYNWGSALLEQGKPDEAAVHFSEAVRLKPDDPEAHCELGTVLLMQSKSAEAIAEFAEALRLKPDYAEALNGVAWIRAADPDPGLRAGAKAVSLAGKACELTRHHQAAFVITLAAAYAETGRFPEAITTAQQARALALAAGETQTVARAEELLRLFKDRRTLGDALKSGFKEERIQDSPARPGNINE